MAAVDAEHNLLFGVLALQLELIDPPKFAEACAAWAVSKERRLADLLVERRWIGPEDRQQIDLLLQRKLKKHGGDALATLGEVADAAAREAIRAVDVPEIRKSLSSLPPAAGYVLVETVAPSVEPRSRSRYTLTRLHAEGGLGKVWVARDSDLNREVALKEILPDQAAHPEAWRRFLKEAQVTGQLEHPNIVPVYELARRPEDDQPFYTMRFVRGRTMRQAIAEHHQRRKEGRADPLERPRLLQAFVNVCQAIAYAHSRGVIHRDLKPENVVLGGFGEVIVLDWGLAKMVDRPDEATEALPGVTISDEAQADATRAGHHLGTPAYMAPEQAEGRTDLVDNRTDIYGLGAILFEVLTGRPPHEGSNTAALLDRIVTGATPRARAAEPTVPPALDAICARAMAKARGSRYARATDLAVDVQRWLADEPVTAYAEPWSRRLARFGKRHRHALQVASALLVAAVVSVVALARVERAQRINRLLWELERGIAAGDWSTARLGALEAKATALGRLDPLQGLDARQRVHQAFARAINEVMERAPRLEPAVVARVEGDLKALDARSPELARALRRNLELRLGRVETTVLAPPFLDDAVARVFDPGQVRVEGDGLARWRPPGRPPSPVLATRLLAPGDARLAVTFDDAWSDASAVGLVLDAVDGGRYEFLVAAPSAPSTTTMGSVRRAGGRLRVAILRNQVALGEATIEAPDGPLRVEAGRDGDVLSLQVNAGRPLACEDPFPLGGGAPRFGIDWPAGVKLEGLLLQRPLLPRRPSPLERGDERFARGEFAAALAAYQEQEQGTAPGDAALGQQLRYKRALCLLRLGREDEAAARLQEVMAGLEGAATGEAARWPLRAACQLWRLRIRQKRVDEADQVLDKLAPSYRFEQLAVLIPAEDRAAILDRYQQAAIWGTVAWGEEHDLRNIRRALRVQELLNSDDYDRRMTKWRLVDVLRIEGDVDGALKALRELLDEPTLSPGERVELLRDFVWVRINQGEAGAFEARDAVDRWLTGDRAAPDYAPLLIERARVDAALGRWDEAEQDCERFFADVPRDRLQYAEFADACLVRGFLRDHRGDHEGAVAAWGEGLLRRWPGGIPPLPPYRRLDRIALRQRSDAVTFGVMLGSLAGDITEAEVETTIDVMTGSNAFERNQAVGGDIIRLFRRLGGISRYVRQAQLDQYRAPRDREFARRHVFRRVAFRDSFVVGLEIGINSAIRVGTYPDGMPAPLDEVIRDAVHRLFLAYDARTLRDEDITALMRLWLGLTLNPSGLWNGITPRLERPLRVQLACGIGRRFVVLGQPRTAALFLRDALDHSDPSEFLHGYARDELARLNPPPAAPRP